MSTVFSRQCEYALQAVMYLALREDHEMVSIKELTQHLQIPYHFLAKILQNLTQKGLLESKKGPSGGFALAVRPEAMNLLHIIEAIDGKDFEKNCILGFEECSQSNPCALHEKWADFRTKILEMLVGHTIAQMAEKMRKPQYQNNNEK
jgi:Rrf2 family iron-sulfur cluster assembly transcriptional regulator